MERRAVSRPGETRPESSKARSGTNPEGSRWIPGSWLCRWRPTRLVSCSPTGSPYFSIALNMSCASRTTREHKPPESKKSDMDHGMHDPRHQGETHNTRLKEFCAFNPHTPCLALYEGQALRVTGAQTQILTSD